MKVCSGCISDKELEAFIESLENRSKCDICNDSDNNVIVIDELRDFFQELIDNFQAAPNGESLKNKIQGNWSLFSSHGVASEVLNYILPSLKTEINNSETEVSYTADIIENISYWNKLKEEIKWEKRFLTNIAHLTEDLGWDGFFNTQYQLDSSTLLYRARVHHKSGLAAKTVSEMGCPPKESVGSGRANPSGIPALYLSDNQTTVIHEVRGTYLDEISVGTFNLKPISDSIRIVDFTEDTPIFQPERVKETIKAKLLREKISKDLSKPMRRYDSETEYIPTQFICEFIKVFTGAEGIRFQSSLDPRGKNLVIFNNDLMECNSVSLVKVSRVNMDTTHI
ncbi:MAG: hypothetical protein ACJASR_002401 [Psychroserpens sp.]|jgi:hypothetical protein